MNYCTHRRTTFTKITVATNNLTVCAIIPNYKAVEVTLEFRLTNVQVPFISAAQTATQSGKR